MILVVALTEYDPPPSDFSGHKFSCFLQRHKPAYTSALVSTALLLNFNCSGSMLKASVSSAKLAVRLRSMIPPTSTMQCEVVNRSDDVEDLVILLATGLILVGHSSSINCGSRWRQQ